MHLNPYGEGAVHLAAELANRRPGTAGELVDRCRAAGLVVDGPVLPADLARILALLDSWESVVDAADERERAERLNRMLAADAAHPRLTDHADGWHLHYRDDHQPFAAVLSTLIAVGTAFHLVGRGMHRLGRCAVAECTTLFADTTRTGRRRYCSQLCANRDAVRRHRRAARPATGPARA
ncbi:CGNR zinc finger domain-containing protein [Kitasatospora sp. NPDC006786]|uniref:CGNR zinc finger domain-containing protein n=1 Tax=unclassified Kitasatospora TaxID=2633591 RepID=UPI00337D7F61